MVETRGFKTLFELIAEEVLDEEVLSNIEKIYGIDTIEREGDSYIIIGKRERFEGGAYIRINPEGYLITKLKEGTKEPDREREIFYRVGRDLRINGINYTETELEYRLLTDLVVYPLRVEIYNKYERKELEDIIETDTVAKKVGVTERKHRSISRNMRNLAEYLYKLSRNYERRTAKYVIGYKTYDYLSIKNYRDNIVSEIEIQNVYTSDRLKITVLNTRELLIYLYGELDEQSVARKRALREKVEDKLSRGKRVRNIKEEDLEITQEDMIIEDDFLYELSNVLKDVTMTGGHFTRVQEKLMTDKLNQRLYIYKQLSKK